MNTADISTSITKQIAQIDERLERHRNVINGTPYVIQLSPGLYLVADGERYRGGSINGRVVCYSRERSSVAAAHVRKESAGVFDDARVMHIVDALETERAALVEMRERLDAIAA